MWPRALRAQARREHVAAVDHAPQVHAHDPAPVVERHLADAAADGDAGVVDDEVDAAERALGGGGERLDLFDARDVAAHGGAADLARRSLRGGLVDVGADDARVARAGELETEGAAEAAAGAGDDGARRIGQ